MRDLRLFDGINSSRLIATGVMVNAYVVPIKENKGHKRIIEHYRKLTPFFEQ